MADLLTHVLVAYIFGTVFSWYLESVTPALVTVAMAGAVVPDLNRLELVVPAATVESTLGLPFSWSSFHTVGGAVFLAAIGSLLVTPKYRLPVLSLLALGAGSHLFVDTFMYTTTGLAGSYLWPLSSYRIPIDGFYKSYDRWPLLLTSAVAAGVWVETRRREPTRSSESPSPLE